MTTPCTIHVGDALAVLRTLPASSAHCCVTSPPYWGLRDYGAEGQIGLEETPAAFVAKLVEVFREVRRVLRDDGVAWVNMGDSYAGSRGGGPPSESSTLAGNGHVGGGPKLRAVGQCERPDVQVDGLKPKDLVGVPWLLALALRGDGWYLRSECIWSKPNPMPESVDDRPTKAHEHVFLLTKSPRYFYDAEAVREKLATALHAPGNKPREAGDRCQSFDADSGDASRIWGSSAGRNLRTVWSIPTQPYTGAHFATFPKELADRCILAGTSTRGACNACGAPWARIIVATTEDGRSAVLDGRRTRDANGDPLIGDNMIDPGNRGSFTAKRGVLRRESKGWRATCDCPSGAPVPCVVLDPFTGAGTTALAAALLGRAFVGVELNPDFAAMARKRVADDLPLFARPAVVDAAQPSATAQGRLFAGAGGEP